MKTVAHVIWFLFMTVLLHAQENTSPVVGAPAPDFALPYATKDSVAKTPLKLGDLIGSRAIVLAFYPADWSPGCTKELCTMRDNFAALSDLDADILAISGDYVWSHHEWAKLHSFPFRLLSDHAHTVAKKYASLNEKTLTNKRTVFVIDNSGKIAYADMAYSVADLKDFEELKAALAALK